MIENLAREIKSSFSNYNRLTIKLAKSLVEAQEYYAKQGARTDLLPNGKKLETWSSFLIYTGIATTTAYRWISHYDKENQKLLTTKECKEREVLKRIEQNDRIAQRKTTGEVPNGWTPDDEKKWNESIKKQEEAERANQETEDQFFKAKDTVDNILNNAKEDQPPVEPSKETSVITEAIDFYLKGLNDDSRKIEACHNIIKHCKLVGIGLQSK